MIEQYKKSYEDAKGKLDEINQQQQELENSQYESIQQYEGTIQTLTDKNEDLSKETSKLQEKIESKNTEVNNLKNQVIKWQDQHRKAEEKLKDKQKEFDSEL